MVLERTPHFSRAPVVITRLNLEFMRNRHWVGPILHHYLSFLQEAYRCMTIPLHPLVHLSGSSLGMVYECSLFHDGGSQIPTAPWHSVCNGYIQGTAEQSVRQVSRTTDGIGQPAAGKRTELSSVLHRGFIFCLHISKNVILSFTLLRFVSLGFPSHISVPIS